MSQIEAYHSSRGGSCFLGLRQGRLGGMEIVYDDGVAKRAVWRIKTPGANLGRIGEAMKLAVDHLRVVPALQDELRKRSILIERVQV